ncbi:MAG: exlusion protein FxsA [Gammaproteobacteria bacterium]|nr:MAG: exlusion protein FxsA [Gammaproteobacteria bacterium]
MRLFFIMVVVTTIEVILIAKVGGLIGFWPTFLIIIATALLGSWQLRQQWGFVIGKLQTLQSEPSQTMLEALVLLICGVLLITPGFLTDIIGFLGLIPAVRERFVAVMRKNADKIMRANFHVYRHQSSSFDRNSYDNASSDNHIIEGEFERKDEP